LQTLVGEFARPSNRAGGVEHAAKRLIHGLVIWKGFRDGRLQQDDVGSFAISPGILAPYATLHCCKVIL